MNKNIFILAFSMVSTLQASALSRPTGQTESLKKKTGRKFLFKKKYIEDSKTVLPYNTSDGYDADTNIESSFSRKNTDNSAISRKAPLSRKSTKNSDFLSDDDGDQYEDTQTNIQKILPNMTEDPLQQPSVETKKDLNGQDDSEISSYIPRSQSASSYPSYGKMGTVQQYYDDINSLEITDNPPSDEETTEEGPSYPPIKGSAIQQTETGRSQKRNITSRQKSSMQRQNNPSPIKTIASPQKETGFSFFNAAYNMGSDLANRAKDIFLQGSFPRLLDPEETTYKMNKNFGRELQNSALFNIAGHLLPVPARLAYYGLDFFNSVGNMGKNKSDYRKISWLLASTLASVALNTLPYLNRPGEINFAKDVLLTGSAVLALPAIRAVLRSSYDGNNGEKTVESGGTSLYRATSDLQ